MREQRAVAQEGDQLGRDLGEARLAAQLGAREAVDSRRFLVDLAVGVEERVELAPGREIVDQLQRRDLDHAVAGCRVQPRRLGIEQHRAAHRSPAM